MWNGLWKLTAMVGVIGIGLFAAWQAQKGMNLTLGNAPSESRDTKAERALKATDDSPSLDLSTDQQEPNVASDSELEPTARSASRREKKRTDSQSGLFDDFADDQSQVKKAAASDDSNSTARKVIPVKRNERRPGLDFRKDAEEFDVDSEPKQLANESNSTDAQKKSKQKIRQISAESDEDTDRSKTVTASAEAESDPFADDATTDGAKVKPEAKASDRTTAESSDNTTTSDATDEFGETAPKNPSRLPATEKTRIENPKPPAGRARISSDFGTDSEPPRSRRAKQSAGKRSETRAEAESDPFESDSQPAALDSAATSDALGSKEVLATKSRIDLGAPAQVDQSDSDDSFSRQDSNSNSAPAPKTVPDDISTISSADGATGRSDPKRSRLAAPAQLSDDSNARFLNEPLPRSRDPQPRRAERDQISPVDMVGDGVIGEASQRGIQQPRLTIEKIAQQQAVIDKPFIYSIIVKNTGTVDAHNVVIEDRIPKGTELLGTAPQAELSGKRLIWNQLVLKPNEEKKISIKVVPKHEGPVGSVARVYFATEVSAEIVVAAPQLDFTVKAPAEVRIGQQFDLVFTLKNVGTVDASNIIVRDLVPDELKHEAGSDIECPIGKMVPQECREIVLPVTATKTGSLINKAYLTADSGVKKSLESTIDVIGEVLVLTRTGHNRLYVEKPAAFTNNIRNEGNRKADRIRIAEVVPAGMQFETASDGGKYDENLRAVVWTVGPLAPGADKSLTVNYVPKETGIHAAKITATGNAGSTAAVQSAIEVIGKPELQMETLSATGAVTVGDRITSKFQLNNNGTAGAKNVQLRIKLPRELKLISVKGAKFQQTENGIIFETIEELPPRSKAAYELVLEPIAEADAQLGLEISADHLTKPGKRVETIQIARDALK